AAMGRTFLGISGPMLHTRQMEAGLVRREIVLRSEFDRLRHADEERMRWDRQREREAMLAEERQRMLDLAKELRWSGRSVLRNNRNAYSRRRGSWRNGNTRGQRRWRNNGVDAWRKKTDYVLASMSGRCY
ncbi:vesicular transport-associated repeat protein, partial [Trypanosoma cruzi]